VFNAAGKFVLLAPNLDSVHQALSRAEEKVNDWLTKVSLGESALGMSCVDASAGDFVGGRFARLWERLGEAMEERKFHKVDLERFGGAIQGYLDAFNNDLNHPLCPYCGKRPSSPQVEKSPVIGNEGSACVICRDHIFLGAHLVKKTRLAITTRDAPLKPGTPKLLEPVYGQYQVAFVDGGMNDLALQGKLLKYWDISCDPSGEVSKNVTARFINGYVPVYRDFDRYDDRILVGRRSDKKKEELIEQMELGVPKTFAHLACKALRSSEAEGEAYTGAEALGVLKADVDQLGLLMACGIKEEHYTLSRLATLSRQFHWYFAVYLPHFLATDERFQDVYTVFAGGDDLFLIGPWNRMIELAAELRSTFEEYTCANPEIHFSAGITLHKPHTPLGRLAAQAEEALEKSKKDRNCLTLFGETADWTNFLALQAIKGTLLRWKDQGIVNNAMLYRLNDFIRMAEGERCILRQKEIGIKDMECLKWHALFHYFVERNVGRGLHKEEKKRAIEEFSQCAVWLKKYGAAFKMALWDVLYQQRRVA
ncbi:MAG: type III-A CRISPR-associated protein Cas10/Csm1, partial [Desulforhabdus sp.]|jgi:CRISPR-associated protein Csm1|nr:type III-A CRISPR-associated protein Cas10/Csm1 [Desulforhabdus sp.]